jgi:hypothetical protein
MNLANLFRTVRRNDRERRLKTQGLANNQPAPAMPAFGAGIHPAMGIIYDYREEALDQIRCLQAILSMPANRRGDDDLNCIAIYCEIAGECIRKYLNAKQAGTASLSPVPGLRDTSPHPEGASFGASLGVGGE